MNYRPDDDEKTFAATVQLIAAVGLFLPGLVVRRSTLWHRSPYVRYWAKVSVAWSVITAILLSMCVWIAVWQGMTEPLIAVSVLHALLSVMGAFAAMFNSPFRYVFVGRMFCRRELSLLWYDPKLIPPKSAPAGENDEASGQPSLGPHAGIQREEARNQHPT